MQDCPLLRPSLALSLALAFLPRAGSALDCAGAAPLACNVTALSTTLGGTSTASSYPCGSPAAYDGPERVFTFNNPRAQTVSFLLGGAAAPELDVILVDANAGTGGCAEAECLDLGDSRVIAFDLAAGDYYVVVDGRSGVSGPFDLKVICGTTVLPPSVSAVLDPSNADPTDDCVHEDKTLFLNPTIFQADVLFTLDVTASQQPTIDNLKTWSREIIDRLNLTIDDVRFGLVSYRDYDATFSSCAYTGPYGQPGDWPYNLELPMTNDLAALRNAIDALVANNGGDRPESMTRCFFESYSDPNIGFRPGSAQFVINLSDDVPHDCDYRRCDGTPWPPIRPGVGAGSDPGRDATMGTADDLDLLTVLGEMAARRILLFHIYTQGNAEDPFRHIAAMRLWGCWTGITGGAAFDSIPPPAPPPPFNAAAAADRMRDIVRDQLIHCDELKLAESPGFAGWLRNLTPAVLTDVDLPDDFGIFSLDICPPPGTLPGDYDFTVDVLCDGIKLAEEDVSIQVTSAGPTCTPEVSGQAAPRSTCAGDAVNLSAVGSVPDCNGTIEYRWRGNNGYLRDWSSDPAAVDAPTADATYTVDIRCVNPGCQTSGAAVSVTVSPNPVASAGAPRDICQNNSVAIGGTPTASGGTPPFNYEWSAFPADPSMSCTSGPACSNPTVTPAEATSYTVRVIDQGGCFRYASTLVNVVVPGPAPNVTNTVRMIKDRNQMDIVMSWSAPNANEIAYNVRRSDVKNFGSTELLDSYPASFGTTYVVFFDVTPGISPRFYRVTTLNCAGQESPI